MSAILLGRSVWEARTNSIRNNSAGGASAGSPGTIPTNWSVSGFTSLTRTVVGTGTEFGLPYIDIRYNGTTGGTFGVISFDSAIVASEAQVRTTSLWARLVAGAATNITNIRPVVAHYTSGGAFVTQTSGDNFIASIDDFTRRSVTATMAATTGQSRPWLEMLWSSGVAVDFTLRIYAPQEELGASASPVILTTGSAATRAADTATITDLSAIGFNASEGTIVVEFVYPVDAANLNSIVSFNDNTTNNQLRLYTASAGRVFFQARAGAVSQADIQGATGISAGATTKIAVTWAADHFGISVKGAAAVTDTSGSVPVVDRMMIGRISSGAYANTPIPLARYISRKTAFADLPALSA